MIGSFGKRLSLCKELKLEMETAKRAKIGVVGSGLIGRAWSMLFASVGYQVILFDISPEQLRDALEYIGAELKRLEETNCLRGNLNSSEQYKCIKTTSNIKDLAENVVFIQECIPERIEWKKSLYQQLDDIVDARTIISSSTSTFIPSLFSQDLKHKENILVSHPLNPPYFIPLVEIVPSPWTAAAALEFTKELMLEIKQKPITLKREVLGFATNRIQYAILNEVWHLVANDILTVAEVDAVMTHGLGLRYAFLGPLETAHLNADGITDYMERFGQEIWKVSQTYDPSPEMKRGKTLEKLSQQCEEVVPRIKLDQRRAQRDEFLKQLNDLKKQFET